MASITSSSDRASAWISSRSIGVTNVRLQALDRGVRHRVALVLHFLDLVGLVQDRVSRRQAFLRAAARPAAARRPWREEVGEELFFSRRSAESQYQVSQTIGHTRPSRPPAHQNLRIVADSLRRCYTARPRAECSIRGNRWPFHNEVLALVLGGGQGSRLFPLTQLRSKPAVPICGQVPPHRHSDQQLPARRHPPDLRPDPVQLGVAQPAHRARRPGWISSDRDRRDPGGRTDARQLQLVSGHGRRRPAGGAAHHAPRGGLLRHPGR